MLRTLIKVTCGYPAISDEAGRNSKSIMRMLSPDVSGCQSVYGCCQSCRTPVRESSGPGKNTLSQKPSRRTGHNGRFFYVCVVCCVKSCAGLLVKICRIHAASRQGRDQTDRHDSDCINTSFLHVLLHLTYVVIEFSS